MKFLSSSSASSSSAASTAAAATVTSFNSTGATASCLAGMFRRLLCFNSLPTYPSDQIKDLNSGEFDNLGCLETEEKVEDTANPGIVARLMGLESMPPIDFSDTQLNSNSIERSGSMNHDSWRENEWQHRRAKTSLSFREMPTFLEHEGFFVLSFENLGENKEFRSKGKRSETDGGKLRRRKAERCRRRKCVRRESMPPPEEDRENQDPNEKLEVQLKPINHKENSDGGKQGKEEEENVIVEAEKAETECNSENSSPVSVLDFCESIFHPIAPTSEEDARLNGPNSRRKLSAELENHEHSSSPSEPSSSTSDIQKREMIHGRCLGSRKKECQRENYAPTWGEICKIAEREITESKWVYRELSKLEDFEAIGAECELQILENLVNEVVDQLIEPPPENL